MEFPFSRVSVEKDGGDIQSPFSRFHSPMKKEA